MSNTIILAFSGGLDTSAIVPWLKEKYDSEVIAYCCDLGNAPNEAALREWADTLGVKELIYEDLEEQFAQEFFLPAMKAEATYQSDYLLGTALARPLIARQIAKYAKQHGAFAIAHGATGKGNDQLRFEQAWAQLCPEIEIIAPWKIWDMKGRQELVNYLSSKGITYIDEKGKYSIDTNLVHNSTEGSELENPELEYSPEEVFQWTRPPGKTETKPTTVTITFDKGTPIQLDGKATSVAGILKKMNTLGAEYGLGVVDLVEERMNGIKSRGIYETPGGHILYTAIKQLKQVVWDRTLFQTAQSNAHVMANLIYDGHWYTPTFKAISAFFDQACDQLTGEITLKLWPGLIQTVSRKSQYSLYSEKLVSFEEDEYGLHPAAQGYSKTLCFKQRLLGEQAQKN